MSTTQPALLAEEQSKSKKPRKPRKPRQIILYFLVMKTLMQRDEAKNAMVSVEVPCRLDYSLHPDGALVPVGEGETPVRFDRSLGGQPKNALKTPRRRAEAAIRHTLEIAHDIRNSMYSDWAKFRPVTEAGTLRIVPFKGFAL